MTSDNDFDWAGDIDAKILREIDRICGDFEFKFTLNRSCRIEDFLTQLPLEGFERGFCELVALEIELRLEGGHSPDIDEYLSRFPQHENLVRRAFARHEKTQSSPSSGNPADEPPINEPVSGYDANGEEVDPNFLGRYRILQRLGTGGFAIVYLAEDTVLPRQVALKVPRKDRVKTDEERRAFIHDAQIASEFDHPHIVRIIDVATAETSTGTIQFILLPYFSGGDLKTRLLNGPVPCDLAVTWMISIADAVATAHQKGIYHRDLKPANILFDKANQPLVADFGLALRVQERWLHRDEFAGTLPYMSPEAVRGEVQRIDGRSDTWALGVMLYEILSGELPFQGNVEETKAGICNSEPRSVREINPDISEDLEKICRKCLEKQVRYRYATAADLKRDLIDWQSKKERDPETPPEEFPVKPHRPKPAANDDADVGNDHPAEIVPKGLGTFDQEDAYFYLRLLPGPFDRQGLPERVRFWKSLIDERDPSRTFSVGVLHGPSGSGKSSLVKAGILPVLAKHVVHLFVEATPEDTEVRLLTILRRKFRGIPDGIALPEVLAGIRDRKWGPPHSKVLIVFDQFEQWLFAGNLHDRSQLVDGLRHCDGERLQCVVLVREDFWDATNRFMDQLEIPLEEYRNSRRHDLFDSPHAMKVLEHFGRGYHCLPPLGTKLTEDQQKFLKTVISQLSEDQRVICVQLALFAEMFKGRPWTIAELNSVGGVKGLGVTFLEQTFSSKGAPESRRKHLEAFKKLFAALLPEAEADIKGSMRRSAELQQICGYADRPKEFQKLIKILASELKLITVTDPEGFTESEPQEQLTAGSQLAYYQLTHDYLVPSIREWLRLKNGEDWRGRVRQMLNDLAVLYKAHPEDRHLPSLLEHIQIRLLTNRHDQTEPQKTMLSRAARVHARKVLAISILMICGILGAYEIYGRIRAEALVNAITSSDLEAVEGHTRDLEHYRRWAVPRLLEIADSSQSEPEILKANLALLKLGVSDKKRIEFVLQRLLNAPPEDVLIIARILEPHKSSLTERLWILLKAPNDRQHVLRIASVLALFNPVSADDAWKQSAEDIAKELVNSPPFESRIWVRNLEPIGEKIADELQKLYEFSGPEEQNQRTIAAFALAEFLKGDADRLVDLLLLAKSENDFRPLVAKLRSHLNQAEKRLTKILSEPFQANQNRKTRDGVWNRHGISAVCLVQLGMGEHLWPLLRDVNNRSLASLLTHRFAHFGTPVNRLAERLDSEKDEAVRQTLILSLGDFNQLKLTTNERRMLVQKFSELYHDDPSSGIHGAARWVLERWNSLPPIGECKIGKNDWFVNSECQSFAVIHPPVEVLMKGPNGEPSEKRETFSYTYAIGMHEVTVGQFQAFRPEQIPAGHITPTANCPMNDITWHDAAAYCNWLSEREGLECCYEEIGDQKMRIRRDWRQLNGYRLPTEAEWFYSCQANCATNYNFGEMTELLPRYAWYYSNGLDLKGQFHLSEVGKLRPNIFGTFDMHGHVWEWLHTSVPEKIIDGDENLLIDSEYVLRGGSIQELAENLKADTRLSQPASDRKPIFGFRLARSLPPTVQSK